MAKKLGHDITKNVHGGQGDAWLKQLEDGSFIVINENGENLANLNFEDLAGAVKWAVRNEFELPGYMTDEHGYPIVSLEYGLLEPGM